MSTTTTIDPNTWQDLSNLEDLRPACQYSLHSGESPAVWAVWYRSHPVCGHLHPDFQFFCAPCWRQRTRAALVYCGTCHALCPPQGNIRRVEWVGR